MTFEDRIHESRFTTKQASEATGVNWETMRGWIKRKIILSEEEDDTREVKSQGSPYMLSFTRVMQIAITAHFVSLGVPAAQAGTIALSFTDIGRGTGGWVGNEPSWDHSQVRSPGHLYKDGYTFLAAYAGDQFGHVFKGDGMNDPQFFKKLFFPPGVQTKRHHVVGVLWLDPLFRELKHRLGAGDEV